MQCQRQGPVAKAAATRCKADKAQQAAPLPLVCALQSPLVTDRSRVIRLITHGHRKILKQVREAVLRAFRMPDQPTTTCDSLKLNPNMSHFQVRFRVDGFGMPRYSQVSLASRPNGLLCGMSVLQSQQVFNGVT